MPEASSKIRSVPGGNVGPAGGPGCDEATGSATGVSLSDRPAKSAAPTTAISTRSERPRTHGVRLRLPSSCPSDGTDSTDGPGGGSSTGEDCTATPGPVGVATSDQLTPFHHRTIDGSPSG